MKSALWVRWTETLPDRPFLHLQPIDPAKLHVAAEAQDDMRKARELFKAIPAGRA